MPKTTTRSRNWLFTINNPSSNDIPRTWDGVRAVTWQLEEGENGTPHLQGYLQLLTVQRLSWLKRLDNRAHWEPRMGSHEQALAYCTKAETRKAGPFTHGDHATQGQRTDLEEVRDEIKKGKTEIELFESHLSTMSRNYKFFREYRRLITPKRDHKSRVIVIYGPTGTGKTLFARTHFPRAYWKSRSNWWDDYAGHRVVCVDEFYGWLPYDFLLRLLDRYPLMVECKGGFHTFNSHTIILTSNRHPSEWYNEDKCPYAPLERRIDILMRKDSLEEDFIFEKNNE